MSSLASTCFLWALSALAGDPPQKPVFVVQPSAFKTLINPACSHCRDEAKRRALDLKPSDRVLTWTRGYSEGGAIPIRFFLSPYRVISDSYGVFVYDPDAGYARGFAPSYDFRFHGWRNGVMVIKHKDGTLYSALTGVAFDGPKKSTRLTPIPTVVSDWGWWLAKYPQAVAYHMFDQYQPVEIPTEENPDSVKSRGKPDPRLRAREEVLGVWSGKSSQAYPIAALERSGFLSDVVDGEPLIVFWEPKTRTAAAYRAIASQPRKYKAPEPDESGVSKPDFGLPIAGTAVVPARKLTLTLAPAGSSGRFMDAETKSSWDVAGRCVAGDLKGWTLEWVDSVQVKWFAWAAEHPETSLYSATAAVAPNQIDANKKIKEIAGTAEFLRLLPKPFGNVKSVDAKARTATLFLMLDGEYMNKTWPLEPDAEVMVHGWWGRLEQFKPHDEVWVWLKLDRKKKPVSIAMLADTMSEWDMHRSLRPNKPTSTSPVFSITIEETRKEQKAWLRKRWEEEGLPGTLTFHHVFSGELELALDHEAMQWGRSLKPGDLVHLQADPLIKAVVKSVVPWRERTVVRLVVGELESSELRIGQRLALRMTPPQETVENSIYPPDMDRERTKAARLDWFLASMYCTCGVDKDTCTGDFYTLASCNPNGCGMPNHRRAELTKMIDEGMTDKQIFDQLLKDAGPLLLRPHLRP